MVLTWVITNNWTDAVKGRAKALSRLVAYCKYAQRTRDLQEKLEFVQLEIELTQRLDLVQDGCEVLPMAASFARRREDPGIPPTPPATPTGT